MTPNPDSVAVLREVVAFLLGEAPLEGRWYGDRDYPTVNNIQRPYWWRKQLREAFAALEAQASAPDPWQPSDAGYDRSIHSNPDASAWADFFVATFPGLSDKRDLMLGWFANAMMAMHDGRKQASAPGEVDAAIRAIEARNAYLHAHPGEAVPAMQAAIRAARAPSAHGEVGYIGVHVAAALRKGRSVATTITPHMAMTDDVAIYTSAPAAGDGWRPIAEAPKDGRRVLLRLRHGLPAHVANFEGVEFVGKWLGGHSDWAFAAPVGHAGFPDDWMAGWRPLTHQEPAR